MSDKSLLDKMEHLELKINSLEDKIDKLIVICGRMNTHITFVEQVYSTLKTPINYISSSFSSKAIKND